MTVRYLERLAEESQGDFLSLYWLFYRTAEEGISFYSKKNKLFEKKTFDKYEATLFLNCSHLGKWCGAQNNMQMAHFFFFFSFFFRAT